ncbi:hypothetical protein ACVWYF_001242 [Hymenobacter sp. UYAg731]
MKKQLLLFLLPCVSSCTSPADPAQTLPQGSHYFSLSVADTNPMHGTDAEFAVEVPWWKKNKTREGGALYWYSNFKRPKTPEKAVLEEARVPLDTLSIVLNRAQLDTIYQLARQVFAVSSKPFLVNDSFPPPPPSHDLDNYLVVTFAPQLYSGASLECSGYKEHNEASYKLAAYLEKVKTGSLHR